MASRGDDSDLEDLIAKSPGKAGGRSRGRVEIEGGGGGPSMNPCGLVTGACRLCLYTFPRLCKCALVLAAMGGFTFLLNTVFNPTKQVHQFGADYSAITSAYDLSLSKVHHWCIRGDNDSCKCEDPLEPVPRAEFKSWNAAHKANVADVNLYRAVFGEKPSLIDAETGKARPPIDVAFLGESVVEAMDGRWLGKKVVKAIARGAGGAGEGPEKRGPPDIGKVFERLFQKRKGGPVEGVALGVAGDTTANVLWRLQHDEMPYDFNPQVWWLVLGMNDLTRMQCSEEIVVLGILRVVEEIRLKKPDAKIVINSLLPMVNYQAMAQPTMVDFADFRKNRDNSMWEGMEIDKAVKNFVGNRPQPPRPEGRMLRILRRNKIERKKSKKERRKRGKAGKDDEKVTEGPALQEALERRKKILEKRDKRVRDKVFKDNEKFHPKKPISPFLPMIKKKVLPPVWPSVHLINDKLREFCQKHDGITFFDATPIFSRNEGGGRHRLQSELISPRGHPSAMGFAVWEGQIMGRLHHLLQERPKKPVIAPAMDEEDDELDMDMDSEVEEDPEVEELEPMREVSGDVDEGEDVGSADADEDGSGDEQQSDGKEGEEPEEVKQPSRSEPASEEDEVEEEKPVVKKKVATKKKIEVEADDEEDESEEEEKPVVKKTKKKILIEEDEEESEEEAKPTVTKKVATKKRKEESEPEEEDDDEEDEE
ncbi:hypothetical protein ACHAXT_009335 [Thalassiosira profunda]